MKVKGIKTMVIYSEAEIDKGLSNLNITESDRLHILANVVEAYEDAHYPMDTVQTFFGGCPTLF